MANSTLIVEHYPAPKKPVVVQHLPYNYPRQQQQHPAFGVNINNDERGSSWVEKEKERAEQRKLSVEEYRRRVGVVSRASNTCPFQTGDTIWPKDKKDREEFGQCIVMNITRHFDSYGDTDWCEPPMILSLKPQNFPDNTIFANVEWCIKRVELPTEEQC